MKGLLAILGKPSEAEEGEEDPFEPAFLSFRAALKSGDAAKAKKAFRLMMGACEEEEGEEGEDYEE